MKITKSETLYAVALLTIFLASMGGCAYSMAQLSKRIQDSGGMKNIIIEAGKEVKDIAEQINES
jgi:cell division protein YceG involved in septum cleavage